ncbi:hypothetical protein H0H81_009582 [Sphagnurus paluster]|uniref:F-box domain-containing protein n=1 Tax=Sphagnurus paluster TaxID=117069 RepID=A0A9P7GPN4_9AGAR|nr:hypothetical protein H0H81_009582 [Sphagnurus paluster]
MVQLQSLPVELWVETLMVLEDSRQLDSFKHFLLNCPEAKKHVRYLWIMGEGHTSWRLVDDILASCTNIVSLACTSRTLTRLCASPSFAHVRCTELNLIETSHLWLDILESPHALQFCAQLTKLRLREGLTPELPKHCFPRLTHIAFSSRPIQEFLRRHLDTLKPLPALQHIVVTTFWWREAVPDISVSEVLELDHRLAVLHCREKWSELGAWTQGVCGGFGLWEQAKLERRSMKVFSGAFRALQKG